MASECEPTPNAQRTQPKGIDPDTDEPYEPIEIPVPSEGEIEGLLGRAAKPRRTATATWTEIKAKVAVRERERGGSATDGPQE